MTDALTSSPAPPKGASLEDELSWYKSQYEQVESELHDFQESSKELEAELEKDIEASEKRERELREKVESVGYEVEEWKTKHKQAKEEANRSQNALQKEITTLRDSNRTLTLRLRDIEVANDDFEKQARHQTSSLEDLESKYNVAIERGVMMEEEVKNGEQERENLRIETQRLRDELNDLKVEAEITQEKLRAAEETIERLHARKPNGLVTESLRPPSPLSEASTSATTMSSPTVATPPAKSGSEIVQTSPPSPPLSDVVATSKTAPVTPALKRTMTTGAPPKSLHSGLRPPRHSRGPSLASSTSVRQGGPTSAATTRAKPRASTSGRQSISSLPQPVEGYNRAGSLHQLQNLRTKMRNLEQRVHRVHSKLPAPTTTPPRASPRQERDRDVPSSVTLRTAKKRPSMSVSMSTTRSSADSRLSFGKAPDSRPSSRTSLVPIPSTAVAPPNRPSSRLSGVSGIARPPSQAGHYNPSSERRPRSSISGSFASLHGPAAPTLPSDGRTTPSAFLRRSEYGARPLSRAMTPGPRSGSAFGRGSAAPLSPMTPLAAPSADSVDAEEDGEDGADGGSTPTARRPDLGRSLYGGSGMPAPGAGPTQRLRRMSSGIPVSGHGRRLSAAVKAGTGSRVAGSGAGDGRGPGGDMKPPAPPPPRRARSDVDVGETF